MAEDDSFAPSRSVDPSFWNTPSTNNYIEGRHNTINLITNYHFSTPESYLLNMDRAMIYEKVVYQSLFGRPPLPISVELPARHNTLTFGEVPGSEHELNISNDRVSQQFVTEIQSFRATPAARYIDQHVEELVQGPITEQNVTTLREDIVSYIRLNRTTRKVAKEIVCALMYLLTKLLKETVTSYIQRNTSAEVQQLLMFCINDISRKIAGIVEEHGGWEQVILDYVSYNWNISYGSLTLGIAIGGLICTALTFLIVRRAR